MALSRCGDAVKVILDQEEVLFALKEYIKSRSGRFRAVFGDAINLKAELFCDPDDPNGPIWAEVSAR